MLQVSQSWVSNSLAVNSQCKYEPSKSNRNHYYRLLMTEPPEDSCPSVTAASVFTLSSLNTALRSSAMSCADGNLRRQRRLRVEDDLWDLAVLHGRAVVVSRGVAEGEAGFGAGAGRLVRDLPHAFSAVVRVRTL